MIPELGQLSLVLALLLCLVQASVPLLSRLNRPHRLAHLTQATAAGVFFLVSTAFAALLYSHATSDFTVLNVVLNSHTSKPLLYKIVGSWGNHEGSMLLWMQVLATFGLLVALLPAEDRTLKSTTLSVLGLVASGFLGFILFTSNPFLRVFPAPENGEDMNPILQDIGLAFHPPTLYVGYVGFGIVFCYAIAGLLRGRIDSDWARTVQPWILLPWTFLTLGIGAGSWWAYRELGWGGWWFWDPVENVSLLPWLVGTALLHSNLVLERRGQLGRWVVLLAILAFTLSLIGTFIVRSGLITSVHAFAADPTRGLYILGYIVLVSGAALLIYGFAQLKAAPPVTLLSRSGFILINNLLLVAAAAIVLLAILYPLALELLKLPSISVGPSYFRRTVIPMTAALPLLAALAPLMAWDRTTGGQLRRLLLAISPALLVAATIGLTLFYPPSALLLVGLGMVGWLLTATVIYARKLLAARVRFTSAQGLRHLATLLAHGGFALFVLGMTLTSSLKQTYEAPLDMQHPITLGDYTLTLTAAERHTENNYTTRRATFEVQQGGHYLATLTPELRYYAVRGMQTSEASLHSTLWRDVYLVLGESNYANDKTKSTLGVRLYITPGQQFLWMGFVLVAMGGAFGVLAGLKRHVFPEHPHA